MGLKGRFKDDGWSPPCPSTLSYWGDDIYPNSEGSWKQPGRQATAKLTKLLGSSAVNDLQLSFAMNRISVAQSGTGVPSNAIPSNSPLAGTSLSPSALQLAPSVFSPPFFCTGQKFGGAQGL